jgi:hypothetical protein
MSAVLQRSPSLPKLDMKDETARKLRALHFMRGFPQERKFGFWHGPTELHLPMPVAKSENPRSARHFATLSEIEAFAGYIIFDKSSMCRLCLKERKAHDLTGNGKREFVFQPIEGGYLYRWPEGLMHYYEAHRIEAPGFMPLLIQDFDKARNQGFWR